MKRSDKERLKKIVATWESLKAEMHKRGITPELLLEDRVFPVGRHDPAL